MLRTNLKLVVSENERGDLVQKKEPVVGGLLKSPTQAHVIPFIAWVALMFLGSYIFNDNPWGYVVQTAIGFALLFIYRPWRWYKKSSLKNVPPAIFVGIIVAVIWIAPEMRDGNAGLALWQELYLRFGILPLGELPDTVSPSIYAPSENGWFFTIVRLIGSAFAIAIIEEFFWRGFLYRWLIDRNFTRVKFTGYEWEAFLFTCLLFGLEHNRWAVGVIAGVLYLVLLIKTSDIGAACIAHVITNFLLGLYVIQTQSYQFW